MTETFVKLTAEMLAERHTVFDPDTLTPLADNPNRGAQDAIDRSMDTFGQFDSIVVWRGEVLIGNHRRTKAVADGRTLAGYDLSDLDMPEAQRKGMALASNRTGRLGYDDDAALADVIAALDEATLVAAGYDDDHLLQLTAELSKLDADAARSALDSHSAPAPGSLKHNIDVFFNCRSPALSTLAKAVNVQNGLISSAASQLTAAQFATLNLNVGFVDNEFHDYDHERHVQGIRWLQDAGHVVQYATVRDVMTKRECEALGTVYYTLDEVIDMAREVQQLVEHVMVIPKYDCVADIPTDLMLGFSLPSSYGMTQVSIEAFRGRRVHLLGGSMLSQMRALSVLGESVVSLDNNHAMLCAKYGNVYTVSGKMAAVNEVLSPLQLASVGFGLRLALSFAALSNALLSAGCTVNNRDLSAHITAEVEEWADNLTRVEEEDTK